MTCITYLKELDFQFGIQKINIRGNELTDINFANLGTQVKFINTMKYYLASLTQLSSTLDENEKKKLKKQPFNS